VVPSWNPVNDFTFVAYDNQHLLGTPDQTFQLDFTFGFDNLSIPRAYFNNVTYVPQKVPTLYSVISTGKDYSNPIVYGQVNPIVVSSGQIVEIVLNNHDAAVHPFHLHAHQFQVCERPSSNSGTFNGGTRNFPAVPMRRDTVAVMANSYVVIRFMADNPGVQLFHCHIEWHVDMGLTATIIEAPEKLQGITIPADHLAACKSQGIPTAGNAAGNTKNYTDLTGANITPPNPNYGALITTSSSRRYKRTTIPLRPRWV
jgi:iron transport multicopper oxidase